MKSPYYEQEQDVVQLEISIEKLESLFNKGKLCAADVRCLNCTSKACIWNLCLTACARRMQCNNFDIESCKCCKSSTDKLHNDSSVLIAVKQEHLGKL